HEGTHPTARTFPNAPAFGRRGRELLGGSMKNTGKVLLIVISVLFLVGFGGGLAFAQEAAANDVDISSWFVDTITLAGIVGLVVSFIRKHLVPTLDGISVVF